VDEETWEFPATVTINQLGHNRILFELWFLNKNQTMEYSGIEASLSLEAT
jgi:hypothetical protein